MIQIKHPFNLRNYYQFSSQHRMKISNKEINNKPELREERSLNRAHSKHITRSLSNVKNNSVILNQSPIKRIKPNQLKPIKQKIKKIKQTPKSDKKKKDSENKQKKKKSNFINLKQLKPLNLQKQKQLFFQNQGDYNPFFLYPNISDLNDEQYKDIKKYGVPDQSYLPLALKILQKSKKVEMHRLLTDTEPLTIQQTSKAFDHYLKSLQIADLLSYEFVQNTIAPTSVVHNNQESSSKIMIGLPIHYRKETIQGVMNHQIGTHFLRKHNDRYQKWYKDRKKYSLIPFLQTEQGLAAINQVFSYFQDDKIPPLLYRPALMYYCCYLASKHSFAKMFQKLQQFEPNPDIRWRQCVRVKRGIADTSKPQGMYKDQIYFLGAVEILKNRKKLNFINLHCGKISVEDCLKLTQKGHINNKQKVKTPLFLNDMKHYLKCLDKIAQINFIQ